MNENKNLIEELKKEIRKLKDKNFELVSKLERISENEYTGIDIFGESEFQADNNRIKSFNEILRESEERLKLFYDNTNIGIYRTTTDGKILMANPALIKMLGYKSFEELSKRNLEENGFEPNYSRKQFKQQLDKHGEIIGDENKWQTKNRTYIWVRENAKAIRDTDGKIVYYDGTVENITESKNIEEKLAAERNLLRTLIDALPDRIYAKDINSRFILNNVAHIQALGATFQEEILGKTDADFRPNDLAQLYLSDDKIVLETGKTIINREEPALFGDGSSGWLLSTKVPLRDLNNNIIGLVGNSRDITERKRSEESLRNSEMQLRELNITKDKFFSIIAHDLRSPFQGLLGLIELLVSSSESFTPQELTTFYESLHRSAFNLYDLLENLLEWSLSQRGMIKYNPLPILLSTLVDQNFELLKQKSEQKSIDLINETEKSIEVFVDERMVHTLFRNLITNAIKFTHRKGKVLISSKEIENNMIEICVADTGVGIPKENITKLFRIDEKISTLGTEKEPSSGLGLLLCKDFVDKHGGKIHVESEIGKGSKFIFSLPKYTA